MIYELITSNRSYRRFNSKREVGYSELLKMIESARMTASAANLQRLRYALVNTREECDRIFETLSFAGYLTDWQGPAEDERPVAYITLMAQNEPDVNLAIDAGLAAQSILLTARQMGLGGCMFRSFNPQRLAPVLNKTGYIPVLVIAIGEPSEKVYTVDSEDNNVRYYRDSEDNHVVPKLPLDELII